MIPIIYDLQFYFYLFLYFPHIFLFSLLLWKIMWEEIWDLFENYAKKAIFEFLVLQFSPQIDLPLCKA